MRTQLSLSRDYCPDWGTWEGIREVVQNYLDQNDVDEAGQVKYSPDTRVLRLRNPGAEINIEKLGLLGETTKTGTDARGQFGEGIKIGILALLREGLRVSVRSGAKVWKATIEESRQFNGREVLTFTSSRLSTSYDGVEVTVRGLTAEAWETVRERLS